MPFRQVAYEALPLTMLAIGSAAAIPHRRMIWGSVFDKFRRLIRR
jgi:hypothetical protein